MSDEITETQAPVADAGTPADATPEVTLPAHTLPEVTVEEFRAFLDFTRASTGWLFFNPKAPPAPEVDCFGKHYCPGDIACDGDASPDGDGPCTCRAECRIRSLAYKDRVMKQATPKASGGGKKSAPAAASSREWDQASLVEEFKGIEGHQVLPGKNGSMKVVPDGQDPENEDNVSLWVFPPKGRRKTFDLWADPADFAAFDPTPKKPNNLKCDEDTLRVILKNKFGYAPAAPAATPEAAPEAEATPEAPAEAAPEATPESSPEDTSSETK